MNANVAPNHIKSKDMPVSAFRQILWLPLRTADNTPLRDRQIADHWSPLAPSQFLSAANISAVRPEHRAGEWDYATYLYFHPYIRRFLFDRPSSATSATGSQSARSVPLSVWHLTKGDDHRFIDVLVPIGQYVGLKDGPETAYAMRFHVERCLLYQFSVGVIMLEVELAWSMTMPTTGCNAPPPALNLSQVMDVLDFLRRTHPGFFPGLDPDNLLSTDLNLAGGRYPLEVQVKAEREAPVPLSFDSSAAGNRKQKLIDGVENRRGTGFETPLQEPWRTLLGPVAELTVQLEDERMPYMAYIAVKDPHQISRGDWVRLASADYRGNSVNAPYGAAFLQDFEHQVCYDRYFCRHLGWANTRYLNTGYAFTMVGQSGGDKGNFFSQDALQHFRRHYACMGLLAQFNKAALLLFSNRLATAIDLLQEDQGSSKYRARVQAIQGDLLEFTHRHWFDGVSNQVQSTEMQALWFKQLRLQALYDGVMAESRAAYDFVNAEEQRLQTVAQQNQAAAVHRLTEAAIWVAAFGLFLAALGAGFPIDKPLLVVPEDARKTWCFIFMPDCELVPWRTLTGFFTLLLATGLALRLWALKRKDDNNPPPSKNS
jgi:hypothetical protein